MTLTPGAEFELIWRNDELSDASDPRPAGFAEEQRMDSRIIAVEPPRLDDTFAALSTAMAGR